MESFPFWSLLCVSFTNLVWVSPGWGSRVTPCQQLVTQFELKSTAGLLNTRHRALQCERHRGLWEPGCLNWAWNPSCVETWNKSVWVVTLSALIWSKWCCENETYEEQKHTEKFLLVYWFFGRRRTNECNERGEVSQSVFCFWGGFWLNQFVQIKTTQLRRGRHCELSYFLKRDCLSLHGGQPLMTPAGIKWGKEMCKNRGGGG